MRTNNINTLATKIAAAILLNEREITISDIRAIPFIESDEQAMAVAKNLTQIFNVEVEQVMYSSAFMPQWVDVLRLKEDQPDSHSPV